MWVFRAVVSLIMLSLVAGAACSSKETSTDTRDASADTSLSDSGLDGAAGSFRVSLDKRVLNVGDVLTPASDDVDIAKVAWTVNGLPFSLDDPIALEPGCYTLVGVLPDGSTGSAPFVVVSDTAKVELTGVPLPSALVAREQGETFASVELGWRLEDGLGVLRARALGSSGTTRLVETRLCGEAPDGVLTLEVPAQTETFEVVVDVEGADGWTVLHQVEDIVAGDVIVIQGQSNAVAADYDPERDANVDQSTYIRSFGTQSEDPVMSAADRAWHTADGDVINSAGSIGQWGLRMARRLLDAHGIPLALINGARGGVPINYFARNNDDPEDLMTNYGRLLARLRASGLDTHVRAVLYYQGESDGENWVGHGEGLQALIDHWRVDYPATEHFYVTQVRGDGCGNPNLLLREVQRGLGARNDDVSTMTTSGLNGHDGCHYHYEGGYKQLGDWFADLLSQDLYGSERVEDVSPPNLGRIVRVGTNQLRVELTGVEGMPALDEGVAADFIALGEEVSLGITEVRAENKGLRLTLSGANGSVTQLAYFAAPTDGPDRWIRNARGLGLLAFWVNIDE